MGIIQIIHFQLKKKITRDLKKDFMKEQRNSTPKLYNLSWLCKPEQ